MYIFNPFEWFKKHIIQLVREWSTKDLNKGAIHTALFVRQGTAE